jgi:hypothetical protein
LTETCWLPSVGGIFVSIFTDSTFYVLQNVKTL